MADILLCGGTTRSGLDCAVELANSESRCVVAGRSAPPDSVLSDETRPILYEHVDFADPNSVDALCTALNSKSYDIKDCIFFQRARSEDVIEGMQVAIAASDRIISALHEQLSRNAGSIIFIGSVLVDKVGVDQTLSYHVTKGAVRQAVRYFAVKLGPDGIRVNAINLATLKHSVNEKGYEAGTPLADIADKVTPLRRSVESGDVADAITFLRSPQARAITGHELTLDAGLGCVSQVSSILQALD